MSPEGNPEKTRIQDSIQAHEEANMLGVKVEEFSGGEYRPGVSDYNQALELLDELQEEASRGSESVDKITKPMRNVLAASLEAGGSAVELFALSLLAGGTTIGPYPKHIAERRRHELVERFKRVGDNYTMFKDDLAPARERLEKWKAETEEFANKQETAEEFNKRQAEQK